MASPLGVERVRREPPRTVVAYCSAFVTAALVSGVMSYFDDGFVNLLLGLLFLGVVVGVLAWSVWRGSRAGWWVNLVYLVGVILSTSGRLWFAHGPEAIPRETGTDPAMDVSFVVIACLLLLLLLSPSIRDWTSPDSGE